MNKIKQKAEMQDFVNTSHHKTVCFMCQEIKDRIENIYSYGPTNSDTGGNSEQPSH